MKLEFFIFRLSLRVDSAYLIIKLQSENKILASPRKKKSISSLGLKRDYLATSRDFETT